MEQALALVIALLVSLAGGRIAIALAGRLRYLDHPGHRKLQERPVPLMGGLAILLGVLAGVGVLWPRVELSPLLVSGISSSGFLLLRWLGAGAWLVLIGLVDDRRGLGPGLRLLAQALAVLLFSPELAAWLEPAWLGFPLGVLWLLGLINSLNFLDNMDAAAGSTSFWTALALAAPLVWAGQMPLAYAQLVLASALLGFLWWNRPPARLYMGDAGSTFLGLSLGLFSLLLVPKAGLDPWLAPLLLALPLYDTGTVFWIRWREGRPLWVGDRRHATHRMLARGASTGRTVATLNLWTLAAAALALLLHRLGRMGWPALLLGALIAVGLFVWERRREGKEASTLGSTGEAGSADVAKEEASR